MDSSHVVGSSENDYLSGSEAIESGWTDYIGSSFPKDDDMHKKQVNHKNSDHRGSYDDEDDGESTDDSMVSDASSGPSHSEIPSTQKKAVFGRGLSKHTSGGCCSRKTDKQRDGPRINMDKGECMLDAKTAASHNGLKVRKTK